MLRTQISLTDEQMAGLRRLAQEQNRSIASILRDVVDQLLLAGGMRERALAAIGAHASGRSDVSVRHDDHLAEAFGE